MKFVVAILVALAVVAAADNVQFTACGTQPLMTVSTLSVDPFPAVPGQNVNVTLIGTGSSSLTAGKYSIQANYMGITILTQTGDVCTLDPAHPCPMAVGPIAISHVIPVPAIAPAGQYDIAISSTDQNGNNAVCLNFVLNIGSAKAFEDEAGLDFEMLEPSIAIPEESAPVADLPSTDVPAPEQDEIEMPEQEEQPEEEQPEQEQPEQEEEDGLIEEEQPEEEQPEEEQPEEQQPADEAQEEEDDGLIEEELPNNAAPAEEDDSIPMEDGEEAEEPADDEEESDQQPVAEDSDETDVLPAEEDEEQDDEDQEQEQELAPRNNEWKSCGDDSYTFKITSITTPDGAPTPGKQFTVLVAGDLTTEITGGSMTLKTEWNGIPTSSDTSNFCDAVANSTTPCPWQVGSQALKSQSVIPDTVPAGDYTETLTAVDQSNNNVFCVVGTFTI